MKGAIPRVGRTRRMDRNITSVMHVENNMMKMTYFCMHLPTGKVFEQKFTVHAAPDYHTPQRLLELLNIWNRQGGNQWKYWM